MPQYTISALGDAALTIQLDPVIDISVNRKVLAIAHALKEAGIVGVRDIVPAYSSVTVHYDIVTVKKEHPNKTAFFAIKEQLEIILSKPAKDLKEAPRQLKIPVCYAEKYGLDLVDIGKQTNLTIAEIIQLHTAVKYRVYMVGFLPGFAYMGEVDERIAVPRKQAPRLQIDEGSVGIAGKQTGIYPLTSPGGWQIIGRTPLKLFDKNREEPVLFAAGDEVQFFSITEDEFHNY